MAECRILDGAIRRRIGGERRHYTNADCNEDVHSRRAPAAGVCLRRADIHTDAEGEPYTHGNKTRLRERRS